MIPQSLEYESILTGTKKILGVSEDDPVFDFDIITHINTCLSILLQYGVEPVLGRSWRVTNSNDTWRDYLGDFYDIHSIRDYIFIQTQILFDPPQNSFVADARSRVRDELSWRIMTEVSSRKAVSDE